MEIRTHGSPDPQKILAALSSILSDRFKAVVVVTNAPMSPSASSSGGDAHSLRQRSSVDGG